MRGAVRERRRRLPVRRGLLAALVLAGSVVALLDAMIAVFSGRIAALVTASAPQLREFKG